MFVTPQLIDDWGSKAVFAGTVIKSAAGTVSLSDQTAPRIKAGRYLLKWPDGHEGYYDIAMVPYRTTISDMGHEYSASGELPHIVVDNFGVATRIPLVGSGVLVAVD